RVRIGHTPGGQGSVAGVIMVWSNDADRDTTGSEIDLKTPFPLICALARLALNDMDTNAVRETDLQVLRAHASSCDANGPYADVNPFLPILGVGRMRFWKAIEELQHPPKDSAPAKFRCVGANEEPFLGKDSDIIRVRHCAYTADRWAQNPWARL